MAVQLEVGAEAESQGTDADEGVAGATLARREVGNTEADAPEMIYSRRSTRRIAMVMVRERLETG